MAALVEALATGLTTVADEAKRKTDQLSRVEAQSAPRDEAVSAVGDMGRAVESVFEPVKDRRQRRETSGRANTAPSSSPPYDWADIGFPLTLALAKPWRCPACQSAIRHSDVENPSHKQTLYRCHVCRLELTFDERGDRSAVAPFD